VMKTKMTYKILEEYHSFTDSLAYLGSIGCPTSLGTFKVHVHRPGPRSRRIVPIRLGHGAHRQAEEAAVGVVFTERMLRRYAAGDQLVEPTTAELDSIVTLREVADILGRDYKTVKYWVTVEKMIPSKKIGRISIVLRRDVNKLAEMLGIRPQQGV
jgi:hypothetical protein